MGPPEEPSAGEHELGTDHLGGSSYGRVCDGQWSGGSWKLRRGSLGEGVVSAGRAGQVLELGTGLGIAGCRPGRVGEFLRSWLSPLLQDLGLSGPASSQLADERAPPSLP